MTLCQGVRVHVSERANVVAMSSAQLTYNATWTRSVDRQRKVPWFPFLQENITLDIRSKYTTKAIPRDIWPQFLNPKNRKLSFSLLSIRASLNIKSCVNQSDKKVMTMMTNSGSMMGSDVINLISHLPVYLLNFRNISIINVVFSIVEMVFHFLIPMNLFYCASELSWESL